MTITNGANLITCPLFYETDVNGNPLAGGLLYTYQAGTLIPQVTYTDATLTVPNTNPVVLDAYGKAQVWLGPSAYKVNMTDSHGVQQPDYPVDNLQSPYITGYNSITSALASTATGQGDALIGVKRPETGAVATTEDEFNARFLSVFDYLTAAQKTDVQTSAFTLDCTVGIQNAINAASSAGKKVWVPAGLYMIVPATSQVDEFATTTTAFVIKSNMHIEAEEGAIFKLANAQSTDASPKQLYMFSSVVALSNISWRGLTMDMNGAHNTLSPNRPTTYNNYNFSQINFSGVNGRADDVSIERCTFLNTPGTNCIVAGVTNTVATILGNRWTVRNCVFQNNGTDCNDHSSIYARVNTFLCEGNSFTNDVQQGTNGKTGGYAAHEIHGSNQRFVGNWINNYYQGLYISDNITSATKNCIVADNNLTNIKFCGFMFYHESASAFPLTNIMIADNTVEITDETAYNSLKSCVDISCSYSVTDVTIRSNRLTKLSGTNVASCFVHLTTGTVASNTHTRIVVDSNDAYNSSFGVSINTTSTNGLGAVKLTGNSFTDLSVAGTATVPMGIAGTGINSAGPVSNLTIANNVTVDTRGATFTATTVGTALTVSAVTGLIAIGQAYYARGIPQGCTIASGSGTSWVLSGVPSGGNDSGAPATSGVGIAQTQYGVWLQGAVLNLYMIGNQYNGLTGSEFNNGATITKATGVYFATYTPTSNLVIGGTGGVTLAGEYQQVEKLLHYRITITPAATATHASTANSTSITLPMTVASFDVCSTVDRDYVVGYLSGFSDTTYAYTPTWTASSHHFLVSGTVRLA